MARKALTLTVLAASLGALLTGCTAQYRADRAEAAFPPSGDFVEVTGGRVHYVQAGSGPDVVLLHGAGGNLRDYTFDLMGRLTDRYRVTAFDRPGMGYTDPAPGVDGRPLSTEGASPAQQARMLRDAAAALDLEAPIVVGHSFGGIVAMAWALEGLEEETPVNASAVVSLAGVMLPWPGGLGAYYTVNGSAFGGAVTVPLISAYVPDRVVQAAIAGTFDPNEMPDGYAEHIGAPLTLRPGPFRENVRQVNTLRPHVVEMETRYADLTLPIEILHGEADETVPLRVHGGPMAERYDNVHLTPLPGVGHMPHHTAPEEAVAAIDRAAARARRD